jgi:hypothetical protein
MKKAVLALVTAAVVGVTALAAPSTAEAHWRGRGFGLAGGLFAAAVIGGIASSAYAYGPRYGYYGGYAPAYYGGYGYAPYYGGYGYAPAYYGGYSSYYAPAYYPRVRRVIRPAYAYYGGPRFYGARYYGGGPRYLLRRRTSVSSRLSSLVTARRDVQSGNVKGRSSLRPFCVSGDR